MRPGSAQSLYLQLLILRSQIGSEAAFTELVERYTPGLRRYLRALLHHDADAEDALQEVWTSTFRGLCQLKDARAFTTWLYRIARDRAYRELRRRRVRTEPDVELDPPPAVTEATFDDEDVRHLREAMQLLSIPHRDVLLLRFYEDLSTEQISQVIGCSSGTARSRLFYAKQALREILNRRQHER